MCSFLRGKRIGEPTGPKEIEALACSGRPTAHFLISICDDCQNKREPP